MMACLNCSGTASFSSDKLIFFCNTGASSGKQLLSKLVMMGSSSQDLVDDSLTNLITSLSESSANSLRLVPVKTVSYYDNCDVGRTVFISYYLYKLQLYGD